MDWKLILTITALCSNALSSFIGGIFFHIAGLSAISTYVFPSFIGALILLNIKEIVKCIMAVDIIGLLIFCCVILFSFILYPSDRKYIIENVPSLFYQAIPYYFLGIYMNTDKRTFHWIYCVSVFSIAIHILYFIYYCIIRGVYFDYDMTWAYQILPHVMICFWFYMKNKKVSSLTFSMLGAVYLVFLGARGPIVVLLMYIAVLNLKYTKNIGRIIFMAVILSISYIVFFTEIPIRLAVVLYGYAEKLGFSTRIFSFIAQGSFVIETSGRDQIYRVLGEKISIKPLLGYGIYGEWQFIQNPAHRIWLEIWMHYGIFIGSLLLLMCLYIVYQGYKKKENDDIGDFILLWTVHIATRGIFGATYLGYYSFLLFGLCIGQNRKNKSRIKMERIEALSKVQE